ncbi:PIG-L deacetylase family protein [Mycobacterium sp. IDR2000157661]|uniref:PIG-L deacetylase family protein n=1 Tax=Mycobacterium sp. IDR2000157661 TaxID=2867005 RepID=UPI001EEBD59C|nr:PIG-L family deacetylase [Mycobacterium sp. IDR2000157661]ULE32410.1 PIG-L family deacetylase [Mycobacterium sp. IDR2000157661]
MIRLILQRLDAVAVIGAHCDDIAIGAGATLSAITETHPDVVVHALVLTGGGSDREIEEKGALTALCGRATLNMTVADLPDGGLPGQWPAVKRLLAEFRRRCAPDLVFAPQRADCHQDHRLIAELVPTEFRDHLTLGYEVLKWESDLPKSALYQPLSPTAAQRKAALIAECYPSQAAHDWFDEESFLALMRVRGVQCRSPYAEAFVCEKASLGLGLPAVGG